MDICACGRALSDTSTSRSAGGNYAKATLARIRVLLAAQRGDNKVGQLVTEGGRHCEQLHAVMHDPAHPGVNYFAIVRWLLRAEKRAERAAIGEAAAIEFLVEHGG